MWHALRLYGRYMVISIKAQMQYPASFILLTIAQIGNTIIEFIGIWALFARFGSLGGWSLAQVALFYGTVNITFSIADAISRGFDVFGAQYVRTGNFDRLLLRPRSTELQLAGHELVLHRVGRFAQAIAIFVLAIWLLEIPWTPDRIAMLLFTILGGVAFFFGLMVLGATLCFWSVETLEIMNTLTYGGVQTAHYPLDIYARWLREFLTYIVPLATVAYFPMIAILGIDDPLGSSRWFQILSPVFGFIFLFVCFRIWRFGVRHYTSTGS